ncbi:ankyrin repeat domain-containing protein [Ralstonia solanacearum]|uniref:ankyrin repeat domain-containing protein n=1 Tax=Ralstonia solanacearum TaxID=305 RepID=UPI0009B9EA33|nr:ankyrin repeat domain-containing protein [Ralstonia solanacearum]MBB6593737.1 ankyrin repeat domain-containing protein [Ralstonia solanacearum]MBB6597949.1 ankyrin repeat domain-containing protein [Ralstonia solanacearum]MDB0543956.1 ankyrin repeat domain-containing protein [Ralstonia solanacearum]MDB0553536.1 ankyrin repeat domain-containing protein [Ralstonia solanacearum]MDB0558894.1 ankyrin repeat domain-containing protein [Ralstonia solanacearum]
MKATLNAADVLKRYMNEDLPEFSEISLENVNQVGNFGNSPIHVACVRGSVVEVQALLDGGANVNAIGELGNTPLHEAAGQGHIEVVRLLLAAGAVPLEPNEFGETALDISTMKGRGDIANLIRQAAS